MEDIILRADVNQENIGAMLADAVIDYAICDSDSDDSSIYVTGLPMNFWIRLQGKNEYLVFRTYWPVRQEAKEESVLDFVNRCNSKFILVQFSYCKESRRVWGFYYLGLHCDLIRKQAIHAARRFSEVFLDAIREQDTLDVLCNKPTDEATDKGAVEHDKCELGGRRV